MKSAYFTSNQIDQQGDKIISTLKLDNRRPIQIEWPGLLVLDMQKYFLNPKSHAFVPSAPVLIPGIKKLIARFRQNDFPVIFTQHVNTSTDGGMMASWWRDLLTDQHPLVGLSDQFHIGDTPVVKKSQYDAFYQTGLDDLLSSQEVKDIVITGVMTHLCCDTTARSAFMRGYRVWFAVDGTATYNLDFHLSTLKTLAHGFVTPVLVKELLAAL